MDGRLIAKLYVEDDLVETYELDDHDSAGLAGAASGERAKEALDAGHAIRLEVFDPDGVLAPPDEPLLTEMVMPVGVGPDPAMN
jgi:hypothetical protein